MLKNNQVHAMGLAAIFGLISAGNAFAGPGGTTLTVTKTATATQTTNNIYTWTVQKSTPPNQATYVIPSGKSAPVLFNITATRSGPVTSTTGSVTGSICVTNTGSSTTQGLYITDTFQYLDGATWKPVPGGQVVVPVSAEIPPGPSPVCFPYQIDGLTLNSETQYRNVGSVFIDNYSGHEGTQFETDAIVAAPVTPVTNTVDATAGLSDTITCPTGFSCVGSSTPTLPTTLSGSSTFTYTVTAKNNSAVCGNTVTLTNKATLTPTNTGVAQNSSASSQIYTGSCAASFSGRAYVAGVVTPLVNVLLGDTGQLSPSGTPAVSSSLLSGNIPGILTIGVSSGNASTTGSQENSNASVAGLTLAVGPLVSITADVIQAQSSATCSGGVATPAGSATLTGLKINGVAVTVTGAPNQVVSLPLGLGSITLNKQVITTTQPYTKIEETALDVSAVGIISAQIAHSESDITCNPAK